MVDYYLQLSYKPLSIWLYVKLSFFTFLVASLNLSLKQPSGSLHFKKSHPSLIAMDLSIAYFFLPKQLKESHQRERASARIMPKANL